MLVKILILSFIISSLQNTFTKAPQCTYIKYGNEGHVCVDAVTPTNPFRCKRTLVCVDGKCKNGMYGVSCTENKHCWGNINDDEGVRCINGKCMKEKYNGQKCQHKDECFSGHCVNGVCYGKPISLTCDALKPVECEKGTYCSLNNKVCTRQLRLGDACNDVEALANERDYKAGSNFRVICPGGSRCTGPVGNRTCTAYRIKVFGEACTKNEECSYGAHCAAGKCVDSELSQERNQHICPGFRNCSRLETCVCEGEATDKGRCILTANGNINCGLTHFAPKWQECQKKHGCEHEPDITEAILYDTFAKDTCMNQHCSGVAKEWLCCLYGGQHGNEYSPLINLPYLECGNTGLVVFLILFTIIVVTGIIVGTIIGVVYVLRKYKTKDHEVLA